MSNSRAKGLNTRGSTWDLKTLRTRLEADTLIHQALTCIFRENAVDNPKSRTNPCIWLFHTAFLQLVFLPHRVLHRLFAIPMWVFFGGRNSLALHSPNFTASRYSNKKTKKCNEGNKDNFGIPTPPSSLTLASQTSKASCFCHQKTLMSSKVA